MITVDPIQDLLAESRSVYPWAEDAEMRRSSASLIHRQGALDVGVQELIDELVV